MPQPKRRIRLMCQRAIYRQCGKATYTGCGRHVDQVLAAVPAAERCACPPRPIPEGGFWNRLLGRT
jgi:hypothetical protein